REGKVAPAGKTADRGGSGPDDRKGAGHYSGLRHNDNGDCASLPTLPEADDHYERNKYSGGACPYGRRCNPDRRGSCAGTVLACRTIGRRVAAQTQRGPSFSRRGWFRRALRTDNAEPTGSAGESRDGGISPPNGRRVRLKQVRTQKPFADPAHFCGARNDHG